MPAEWEPHEATWLAWPHELTDWPGKFAPIPWAFAEIVRHLTRVERVFLLVESRDAEMRARATLQKAGAALDAITFFYVPTDRGWMRDSGPIAVVEGAPSQPVIPRWDEGAPAEESSIAISSVQEKQIPRTASHAPGNQGKVKSARDFARDDSPQASGAPANPEREESRSSAPFVAQDRQDDGAQKCALLNFDFNGWAKYDDYKKDAKAAAYVHRRLRPKLPLIMPEHKGRRVVLEGGAIDVNGCGTLLTTEECLLSEVQLRNPGYARFDYAQIFKKYLGVTNVVWLKNGIAGDDTHGHVDDLARFVDETTVVAVVEDDPAEMNYPELQENLALLRSAKDQAGVPLRVETLPMPQAVMFDGQRLPASYANFYIANRIVLVPTFNDRADRVALNTLATLFPTREIVPIYCRDLVLGLGTIHCMTQQFPQV
jgi:agmatine deiminase